MCAVSLLSIPSPSAEMRRHRQTAEANYGSSLLRCCQAEWQPPQLSYIWGARGMCRKLSHVLEIHSFYHLLTFIFMSLCLSGLRRDSFSSLTSKVLFFLKADENHRNSSDHRKLQQEGTTVGFTAEGPWFESQLRPFFVCVTPDW